MCVYTAATKRVRDRPTVGVGYWTGRLNPVMVHLCEENPLHSISGICVRALYLLLYYQAISLVILNGHASKSSSTTRTYKIVSKYWQT